jgi:hypothetical protein
MFGEGHDYAPQYTAMSGDITGSLPVGIQTRKNLDVPYWPAANCYNYKEVWVHPSSRWLAIMRDLAGPATVSGQIDTTGILPAEFEEVRTRQRFQIKSERRSGRFTVRLPEGQYLVRHEAKHKSVTLLPGQRYQMDLRRQFDFGVTTETAADGTIVIKVKAELEGAHRFALRAHNLSVKEREQTLEVKFGQSGSLTWHANKISAKEPWVAVVVPDGDLAERREITEKR